MKIIRYNSSKDYPGFILAIQIPPSGPPQVDKFNEKITDVLLPIRPMAEKASYLLHRWSLNPNGGY